MANARKSKSDISTDGLYTIVRLSYDATLERACELAGIAVSAVNLTQRTGEKVDTAILPANFRIISFDGTQITISERIDGERRVRGFAVGQQFGEKEIAKPREQNDET
jgi:hypothetical protein